jgi:hypothetical protein
MIFRRMGPNVIGIVLCLFCTGYGDVIYVSTNGLHVAPFDTPETAATNIPAALAACEMYDEIEIGPGTFDMHEILELSMPVWIRGARGTGHTVLNGGGLEIKHADVLIQDISVAYSHHTGVRFSADGMMERCRIHHHENGGVIFDGAGTLVNSMVYSNSGDANNIGGIYMKQGGKAINCLIYGQKHGYYYASSPGAYLEGGGVLQNCTIVGNDAASTIESHPYEPDTYTSKPGGGVYCVNGGVIKNCIIWQNIPSPRDKTEPAEVGDNWYFEGTNPVVVNTCSWPIMPGIGNCEDDPQFIDLFGGDYRLNPLSPCIDAGYSGLLYDTDDDVAGNARITGATIDMGAYEVGPLLGIIETDNYQEPLPVSFVFRAHAVGADLDGLVMDWDFNGDGIYDISGTSALTVTNRYAEAGRYTVRCRFRNDAGEEYIATCPEIVCTAYTIQYVSPKGSHTWPFNTWERAATNIQDALDASANTTVMLDDGVYIIQDTLIITNRLVLTSYNGAENTIIRMGADKRCVHLDYPGSVVEKITIQNGAEGGIWCGSNTLLRNCVVESNVNTCGGGVYAAACSTVEGCLIRNNEACSNGGESSGGGCYAEANALLSNCVIFSNTASTTKTYYHAGGVSRGGGCALKNAVIVDCLIEGNTCSGQSGSQGGGVYMDGGRAENMIILNNNAVGAYVPVYPPKYYSRYFVAGSGGGAYLVNTSVLKNATVDGNSAISGAGIFFENGELAYSTVRSNDAPTVTCSSFGQSIFTGSGGGVYVDAYAEISNSQLILNKADDGGGMLIRTGMVTIVNTTIANNGAEDGAGVYNDQGEGMIVNSIIYHNGNVLATKAEVDDAAGRLVLSNCCCKSSSGSELINCITNTPGFVDCIPMYEGYNQFRPVDW